MNKVKITKYNKNIIECDLDTKNVIHYYHNGTALGHSVHSRNIYIKSLGAAELIDRDHYGWELYDLIWWRERHKMRKLQNGAT